DQAVTSEGVFVQLKIYDILGNEVNTLVNEKQEAGFYTINFDGNSLAAGAYIYRLTAGDFQKTMKMVLMK
ncbi:MAG: T9SS type A sorting domain-containing protein, partial [Ignavibacteriaceae bacterium]